MLKNSFVNFVNKFLKRNKKDTNTNNNVSEEEDDNVTIKVGDFFWFLWLEDGDIIRSSGIITSVNSEEKYIEIQTAEVVKHSDVIVYTDNLKTLLKPHRIYLDWIIKGGQVYRAIEMYL